METEKEKEKALSKDRLVGMKVIDGQGFLIGEVSDIAFKVGSTPMTLVVILKTKDGKEKHVSWEEVQAAGDYVVLRPENVSTGPLMGTAGATSTATCPNCGGPLTFIDQYQRWYCMKCQQYR